MSSATNLVKMFSFKITEANILLCGIWKDLSSCASVPREVNAFLFAVNIQRTLKEQTAHGGLITVFTLSIRTP